VTTHDQRIIWTALPNGFLPGKTNVLQISVALSPRLGASATSPSILGNWPDWVIWPQHTVSFTVKVGAHIIPHSQVVLAPMPVTLPATPSELWALLFRHNTPVKPYQFSSYSGKLVRSYPADYVRQFISSAYTAAAATYYPNWPTTDDLIGTGTPQGLLSALPLNQDDESAVINDVNGLLAKSKGALAPSSKASPPRDIVQAVLYTQPLAPGTPPFPPPPKVLVPDFHQIVSTLGKYPVLLRALRLVYDLQVHLPPGLPATVPLSVVASWHPKLTPPGATANVFPVMTTTSSTWTATPGPASPLAPEGVLDLSAKMAWGQAEYPVTEVDVDGSALKTLLFTQAIWRAKFQELSPSTPTSYALPALRSGGLTVHRTGNAFQFASAQAPQDALNSQIESAAPPTLHAEDVTHGYRIDVFDSAKNRWFQLCARVAPGTVVPGAPNGYVLGTGSNTQVVPLPAGPAGSASPGPGETGAPFDEGWVELSTTQAPPGAPPTDLYLHETLWRWAGWSLVADRPGKHWAESSNTPASNTYNPPNSKTNVPLQAAHAAAPGTLPILRFGRVYKFRARSVDLAGNSLGFSPDPTALSLAHSTAPALYGRMEPVASPVLIPRAPRTPGEHLRQLVIRSETYSSPYTDATICERHLVPPSCAEELAEAHGMFDVAGLPSGSMATYDLIKKHVGLTYGTTQVVTQLGGKTDPDRPGGYNWPSTVYYYPAANLGVPYLADPICRGVALTGLPGVTVPVLVSFAPAGQAWPAAQPVLLSVIGGTGPPTVSVGSSGTVVTVKLPHGSMTTARKSGFVGAGDLHLMGLWQWLEQAGKATAAVKAAIVSGRHWMFTPYEEVVFVHAVRQPNPPTIESAAIVPRVAGKTYALFKGKIGVDFGGSSKLDLLASWTMLFDDGVNPAGAVTLSGNAHVADLPLNYAVPVPQSITVPDVRHDFGDTKYRDVSYQAQGTSRFLEYFQNTVSVTLSKTTPTVINAGGLAAGATIVSSGPTTYQPDVDYMEDDTAGTITLTPTSSIPTTSPVDVRYVAPPVTAVSKPRRLTVVSTARPAAPDVRYVLPVFGFGTTSTPASITSTRTGNALRVYLGRPWFSTGNGELLGVVVYRDNHGTIPPAVESLVTRYGRDPIRRTNSTAPVPGINDFANPAKVGSSLTLIEAQHLIGSFPVDVAGYEVNFEATSHQLWYADIPIDTSGGTGVLSAWPFVRLALVRYQPESLAGYEISRVALADVTQLAPDRVATLKFLTPTKVSVTIAGVSSSIGEEIGTPPIQMRAVVQEKLANVPDPDLQWADVAHTEVTLGFSQSAGYECTWSGTVKLPAARGTVPMRLRLSEVESYLYDFAPDVPTYQSRIVYLDLLEI
jgi:hypothetical protein